ncbi:EamA family transporter RarD [Erythrobacter alti]|uniref:EamA family transporter RarD n=1 Tax=Erythrobacter alti TaxID=1896145 RepID=UPI0030F41646
MTTPASWPETSRGRALSFALTAHLIWGLLPLYLLMVKDVPPVEFVAWRTLFTLPICLGFVWFTGKFGELRTCLAQRRVVFTLVLSSIMIAVNWLGYIWAIQTSHVYAASLGYYILPIVMMLMGVVFLKEPLSVRQWAAVALASVGVGALALGAVTTLWVSLLLAVSFGIYGLLRKTVAAGALVGLTIEATILLPLVLAYLGWTHWEGGGTALGRDTVETIGILGAGFVTAIPLILFATAARALPYTVIGFIQFAAPSVIFLLGLTVFGEELKPAQLACFIAIWAAVALFSWDIWRKSRAVKPAPA